ncbi:MAG: PQQ-binding-like beta-propeller repeat protein, partial [Bacteroidota bacterium]
MEVLNNGDIITSGTTGDSAYIRRYTQDDSLLWERRFSFGPGPDNIRGMEVDSEGFLLCVGRTNFENQVSTTFIFRYDFDADQVLWNQRINTPNSNRIQWIEENGSGGDYFVGGAVHAIGGPYNAVLYRLDRMTGIQVWGKQFASNSNVFRSVGAYGGDAYAVGYNQMANGLGTIRPLIEKMDADGNSVWRKAYFDTPGTASRTYFEDIAFDADTVVAVGRGSLTTSGLAGSVILLAKIDSLDGSVFNQYSYALSSISSVDELNRVTIEKVSSGGFIVVAFYKKLSIERILTIRLDQNYEVLWARETGDANISFSLFESAIRDTDLLINGTVKDNSSGLLDQATIR